MKRKKLLVSLVLFVLFLLWTAAVCLIDVQAVGPLDSSVGLATINVFCHNLTGVNWALYRITDWLGLLVPFGFVLGFGCLGLAQWVSRKSLRKIDRSILVLGGFYLAVLAAYVLFEFCVINYRPVLIDGVLEPSYPSSTTVLVMAAVSASVLQLKSRIRRPAFRYAAISVCVIYEALMVVGRLLSGVHWISDIIGGALLSAALVLAYDALA